MNIVRVWPWDSWIFRRWSLGSSICFAPDLKIHIKPSTWGMAAADAFANIKWLSHALFLAEFPGRNTRILFNPALPSLLTWGVHRRRHQPSKCYPNQLRPVLTFPSQIRTISTLFMQKRRAPHIFVPVGNGMYIKEVIQGTCGSTYTWLVGRPMRGDTHDVLHINLYPGPALHQLAPFHQGKILW